MTSALLLALGSVALVSVISLAGLVILSIRESLLRNLLHLIVALAAGTLFGDALIHLLPEALEGTASPLVVSAAAIGGILGFFALEKFLHWHHHHSTPQEEAEEAHVEHVQGSIHPLGRLVLVSDAVHNFVDGLIIGASYLVSTEIGIATTIAVILHEIPQEVGDFGLLLHAGYSRARALFVNFLSALSAIVGTIVMFSIPGVEEYAPIILAFTAGAFLYIAGTDIVPELHKTKRGWPSLAQFFAVLVGVALMFALLLLE